MMPRTQPSRASAWGPTAVAALCLATALPLSACGSDDPPRAAVTVTASGRTVTGEPTSSAPAPSSSPTPKETPRTSATDQPAAGPRLRITHRVSADREGLPLHLPRFTVEALVSDPTVQRAAQAMQEALDGQVAAVVSDWEAAQEPGREPAGDASTEEVSIPVNEAELAVVAWRTYVFTGGAHGVMLQRSVTADVAHGSVVTSTALLDQLQRAGGPAWSFERELRAAARRQLPDAPGVDSLTRSDVGVYPTRAGLHVIGDQCVLACALPPIDLTIAWERLVGPGDDIAALPDAWGL